MTLDDALRSTIDDLGQLLDHIDRSDHGLKNRHRRVIELELDSLHRLESELSRPPLPRRSWSLGQASIPILNSMLNAIQRSAVDVPNLLLVRARQSVFNLAEALNRLAEGQD